MQAAKPGEIEHLGGQVDAVDRELPFRAEPFGGAPAAAAEVLRPGHRRPAHRLHAIEQLRVHDVVDGVVVGGGPGGVARTHGERLVVAAVEAGEIGHVDVLVLTARPRAFPSPGLSPPAAGGPYPTPSLGSGHVRQGADRIEGRRRAARQLGPGEIAQRLLVGDEQLGDVVLGGVQLTDALV